MKNRILSPGEIAVIRTNLREIEDHLGYSIPGGYIDAADLSERVLSPGEIAKLCTNIREVNGYNSSTVYLSKNPENLSSVLSAIIILAFIRGFFFIIESIFNVTIF